MRVDDFLAGDDAALLHRLAFEDMQRFRRNEAQQLRAWRVCIGVLRAALGDWPLAAGWALALEYPMRRLGRRIDAVLATPRGVLVLEFKVGSRQFAAEDRRQVEDYALDLQDFHSASRGWPIVPILVATDAQTSGGVWPLMLAGVVGSVLDCGGAGLGALLRALWERMPEAPTPLDVDGWEAAAYRPVPGIVDAACTLYSHHGVEDIALARADATNLSTTTQAILDAVSAAEAERHHAVLFVTGIPGAGKTLCGLNAVFGAGRDRGTAFLTGNPTLIHVLREALTRDAAAGGRTQLAAARQRTKVSIQSLPNFRDEYVKTGHTPPEHVVVVDEAQRSWSADYAIRQGRDRAVALSDSEPGHLLDIMARHPDWSVLICLLGNGQEIHDGEGGLAEWGKALGSRAGWRVLAAPGLGAAADPRQRLRLAGVVELGALHLDVSIRSLDNPAAAAWVDAVLQNDRVQARRIAETRPVPFVLTRDRDAMRRHLRAVTRGLRRCGLVASSGAKRLRADGLGAELAHMDAAAVANWFLDRWPDVRASDALETVATEFSCQGLELDYVGLCWGGDLLRQGRAWAARRFAGSAWQQRHGADSIANRKNTYRVLLSRARYETVIWVPRGDRADLTRDPVEFDAIAAFLMDCGVRELGEGEMPRDEKARVLF